MTGSVHELSFLACLRQASKKCSEQNQGVCSSTLLTALAECVYVSLSVCSRCGKLCALFHGSYLIVAAGSWSERSEEPHGQIEVTYLTDCDSLSNNVTKSLPPIPPPPGHLVPSVGGVGWAN